MSRFPQLALPTLPRLPGLVWPSDQLLGIGPPEPSPATQAAPEPEISPEEEFSLLRKLMGGAAYVGESLDKPGAAVRGFLSTGDPEQLLHAVPFSETLGFAPRTKISGRKMLQKAGLLGPNKPGFDVGDVAGFAAEVATDPLMLLTGPLGTFAKGATAATKGVKGLEAATTALKAARASVAAGKLTGLGRALKTPAGVAAQIRAGERGLLGLKLPFAAEPFVTMGEGSKVGAWAVEKMFYGGGHLNPLVWMRGIFSHSAAAKNLSEFFQLHPGRLQRAKDLAFVGDQLVKDALVDVGTAVAREEPRLYETLGKIAEHHGALGDTDSVNAAVRTMLEMKNGLPKGEELLLKVREALKVTEEVGIPLPVSGTVRFYHGGAPPSKGKRWVTPDPAYAEGYAAKSGSEVYFVDIPKDYPLLRKSFDDTGTSMVAPYISFEAPEEIAKQLQPVKAVSNIPLDTIVGDAGKLADDFYRYAETIQEMQDATYARMEALGMPVDWLDDLYGKHNARRPSELVRAGLRQAKRQRIDQGYKWWMHRSFRDLPGMTGPLNAAARNPLITGVRDYAAAGRTMFTEAEVAEITGRGGEITAKMGRERFAKTIRTRLKELGVTADEMPEKIPDLMDRLAWKDHYEQPFNEFWGAARVDDAGQMIDDAGELVLRKGQPVTRESELLRLLGETATGKVPIQQGARGAPLAAIGGPELKLSRGAIHRLVQRLRRLPPQVREKGIFDRRPLEDALDYMHSVLEWESNLRSMHNFLGQKGIVASGMEKRDWLPLQEVWRGIRTRGRSKGLTPEGLETFAKSIGAKASDDLRVSPGTANILQNYIDINKPKYKAEWQKFMDGINRSFRGLYFMVWPASHVRNLGGGFFNSWSAGRVDFWELLAGNNAARKYLTGRGELQVETLMKNSDLLKGVGRDLEITTAEGGLGGIPQLTAKTLPGHIFEPLTPGGLKTRGARKALGFEKIPTELAAAGKRPRGAIMEAGSRAYNVVEFLNRVGYAEALAKKGFADSEILNLVKEAQFDYRLASPFEREYMQRGVLFYNWPRANLPFTLGNIAKRPGGRTAQTLRAMRLARGEEEEEYVPEMLRETLGVRTGGTEQAAHFIRQSGLPPEDLNRLVLEGGLPTGRTLERAASTLHPLLLAPLELASDRQFYTGRKISNLWSPTKAAFGREIPALDRILHYSPLSRVGREAAGVLDTRKTILQRGLNALTGFKTSTYDLESLREQDLRRAIERELRRMPGVYEVTTPYVPKARKEQAGPEAEKKLRQLRGVVKRIRDLREERAAREAAAGR